MSNFLTRFWAYYDQLLGWRASPSVAEAQELAQKFDRLFKTGYNYGALNARIELTQKKKAQLLAVLTQPQLPLHNNPAELAARQRVRKLDVSLQN